MEAEDITIGDPLRLASGEVAVVESVEKEIQEELEPMYNLEIEKFHTYYVGMERVLVHNTCGNGSKGGLNSVDDIMNQGQKAFDNFDIDSAYVKPKHLSTSGGNGAKFIGDSKGSAENILRDAMKNGKVTSITDNGLTQQGKQSYRIVIDAGKEIGTQGETLIRIVISEDGGMLSAFPVK